MVTIKDIAKIAKVSPSTVSKALNSRHDVSEETKQKIVEIANAHDFVPNVFGKNLKKKITENIGVIFRRESRPLSGNPFYSRVLEGIEAELAINNFNLVLHLLPNDTNGNVPKMIREKQVDGVILGGAIHPDFINNLKSRNMPMVLVDPKIPSRDFQQILIDNEHGAFLAIQHLVQKGHKRIGFISGDLERESFHQRFIGYKKALKLYNISFNEDFVVTGDLEKGYEHTKQLLNLNPRPTAIFATNDVNAIYGYKAAEDEGLKIPDDLAFVGFDDIALAKMTSPPLTTIRVYKEELGSIAVRNLIKIISGEEVTTGNTLVPVRLIERNSVKEIKN
jgi:LacI family transcriptional regulator, galactose operon repressor